MMGATEIIVELLVAALWLVIGMGGFWVGYKHGRRVESGKWWAVRKAANRGEGISPNRLASYALTVRKDSGRAVFHKDLEVIGYWQTGDWIDGLLELAKKELEE